MQYRTFGEDTKLQFSGHETFPLRYGWLKKAYDAVKNNVKDPAAVFSADEGIRSFGVGKNMVASIRFWALSIGIIAPIAKTPSAYEVTDLGKLILDERGGDPWMEDPASLWLAHWKLASTADRNSTWYWVFNHCPHVTFDRALILDHLVRVCKEKGLKKVASNTIKRDIEVFARTYLVKPDSGFRDDTMECPLTELSLIEPTGQKEGMRLIRGPKPTLTAGVFAFATIEFWDNRYGDVSTLSFDALLHEPGSPGRVFLLDEASLTDLANTLTETTNGEISWSETAGLRQLVRNGLPGILKPEEYLYHRAHINSGVAA